MTKLYVLLSLGKGGDNTFVEGRMSTPLSLLYSVRCYFTCCVTTSIFLAAIPATQTQSPETYF